LYDNVYVFSGVVGFSFFTALLIFAFSKYFVVTVLPSSDTVQPYCLLKSPSTNSKFDGKWSFISAAYPSISPSLYTLNIYTTISFFLTSTGSFVWLYVAVVIILPFSSFVFNFDVSTTGALL